MTNPRWLTARDDGDDGLQMLGRGLDDVDGVPPGIAERRLLDAVARNPSAEDVAVMVDELRGLGYVVERADGDWMNPDCRDGKHAACGGDAWSDELDQRVACGCSCHGTTDVDVVGGYL